MKKSTKAFALNSGNSLFINAIYFLIFVMLLSIDWIPEGRSQTTQQKQPAPVQKKEAKELDSENLKLKILSENNQQDIKQLSVQVSKPQIKYVYRYRTRTIKDTVYVQADDSKINAADYFDCDCDSVRIVHDTIYKKKRALIHF